VLLAGLLAPAASVAEPPGPSPRHGPPGGPHPERFIEQHAERLGLDAETLDAIQKITDESRERGEALRMELHDAHRAMRDLLSGEAPDESAVLQQAEAIGELELEERKNRLRATLQIRTLLTPEQREELIRMREEFGPRGRRGPLGGCQADLRGVCRDAELGRAALQCLSQHWDELSEECRSMLEGKPRRGFGRRR
jgi:Spy/CpxP family protein refolding chaperone